MPIETAVTHTHTHTHSKSMIGAIKVALFCIRSALITSGMLGSLSVECGAMQQPSTDVSLKCQYISPT